MGLFSKKEFKMENVNQNPDARVKVLGSGCKKCVSLEDNVKIALNDMNKEVEIAHITDMATIAGYGVMSTPALVVDEKVVSMGKVLTAEELKSFLVNL
jgi:small redox-active disulfide protein 2